MAFGVSSSTTSSVSRGATCKGARVSTTTRRYEVSPPVVVVVTLVAKLSDADADSELLNELDSLELKLLDNDSEATVEADSLSDNDPETLSLKLSDSETLFDKLSLSETEVLVD